MTVIAVSLVIVALVAAVAYAVPKMYWYRQQVRLIGKASEAEAEKLAAFKDSISQAPPEGAQIKAHPPLSDPGQYL